VIETAELPPWAALLTAIFLFAGAGFALTGSLGLLRPRCFFESVPLALSRVSRSAADRVSRSASLTAVAMCLPTSHLVVARGGVTPGGSSKKPLGHHAVGPDLLRNSIRDHLRRAVAADGRTGSPDRRDKAGF